MVATSKCTIAGVSGKNQSTVGPSRTVRHIPRSGPLQVFHSLALASAHIAGIHAMIAVSVLISETSGVVTNWRILFADDQRVIAEDFPHQFLDSVFSAHRLPT